MSNNELQRTLEWFQQAVPTPIGKNQQVQRGCHFEEVYEELDNLEVEYAIANMQQLTKAKIAMKSLSNTLKVGEISLKPKSKVEDLDALVDQIVTSVGKAYMLGYNVLEALKRVNDSNYSKFEDGKPVFDENGKLAKGRDYFKPYLEDLV